MRLSTCLRYFAAAAFFIATFARAAAGNAVGGPPTFASPVDYDPELTGAQWVDVGDVMNRGINDLVVTHAQDGFGHVSLLLGTGRGTFGPSRDVFSGTQFDQVIQAVLADVNGDGKLDLVIVTTDPNQVAYFTVALGDGKGHFTKAGQTRFNFGRFVIGKFGPDSLPDIFVQAPYALPAAIYRSDGRGGFIVVQLPFGGGAGGLVPVDVNHDGRLDLVGIGQGPSLVHQEQLQTLFGTGDSHFFDPPRYTLPSLEESQSTGINSGITAAAGDLRASGNTDLVIFGADYQYGLTVVGSVYFGHPDGSFDPPLLLPIGGPQQGFGIVGSAAAIADFNGDGIPDIFLTAAPRYKASLTYVLRGVGDGTFPVELQTLVPVAPLYPHIVVADLNGDGRPDVVISDQSSNRGVWVLLNTTSTGRR